MKRSITLYYKDGKSDKVYQVFIEPSGDKWVVNYANGRRGATMAGGTKTAAPVDLEEANSIYDGVVKEKMRKGYQQGEDGAPFVSTTKEERVTGVLPQLLNEIKEVTRLESLFEDPQVWLQEKFDGRRVLIKEDNNSHEISGINKTGLSIGLPGPVVDFVKRIANKHTGFILDGELIGEKFYAFDLLKLDNADYQKKPYSERLKYLTYIIDEANDGVSFPVICVTTAKTADRKKMLYQKIKDAKGEGVVFKRHASEYTVGYGENALKYKFWATCSCLVEGQNGNKRSVKLKLLEKGDWIDIGKCTIPANHEIPTAGQIVEIRYLYARKGGSLYQPIYLGVRDDVEKARCSTEQLKYKPTDSDDDEA